ncbi:MAG: DUF4412 domain-containing protein [Gemmatimonadetes bacterium]|nr:DUF4412 domain-containing protein [Gemmatimonadota bacterium]
MSRALPWIGRLLVAVLAAVPALASGQDVYIESKTHTDSVKLMGRSVPAQDGVSRTWIGDNRIAIADDAAGTSVIFRQDQNKMFVLFPKDQTYYESTLPFQFPAEINQMMSMMKPEITVTPTTEARTVNGFGTTLTKVAIKMMGQDIAMDYWVSKDLGVSSDQLRKVTQAMFTGNPMLKELGDKMGSIEGYPVRIDTRISAMGSTFASWQEVQKVERKAAPAGTYEVPAGYKKTEKLQMGRA